ncbi:exodeoxyribonuclease VII large subunit [Chloroflexota bacterium]
MHTQDWTVSELTLHIKDLLESAPELQSVWVSGELSNVTRSAAGHLYFTMKDSGAALGCVMWRSSAEGLTWEPEHGAAVQAHGRVSVYPVRGSYQFYVDELRPAGVGDLHAQFERLRDELKAEGLFDAQWKQALPPFPRTIGIVTSPQAAALRDVLNVLRRRYPLVRVLLAPTMVQGDQAPPQIVHALQVLDAHDDLDLILLVRGGGSLEELWAFNDQQVARAIFACQHPVVSGVGHETDFTIADFVADLRAPTPSAAAELAVPDRDDLRQRIWEWERQLTQSTDQRLARIRHDLDLRLTLLERLSPQTQVDVQRQRVDDLLRQAGRSVGQVLGLHRASLEKVQARLEALSPLSTLDRGYAVVWREDTGKVVKSVSEVEGGDPVKVRVRDGDFSAKVRSQT